LREKFPKLSDAKLKEDVSIGPKIRVIINNDLSEHLLTETEESANECGLFKFSWKRISQNLQGTC